MHKILIIDDRHYVLSSIECLLKDKGIKSVNASSIHQAYSLLTSEEDIDLVITDLLMPDVSGMDFLFSLKERFPHLGLIAMSGGGDMADGSLLLLQASKIADAVLKKPFEPGEFYGVLNDLKFAPLLLAPQKEVV